jgi:hypothetical protein
MLWNWVPEILLHRAEPLDTFFGPLDLIKIVSPTHLKVILFMFGI